MKDMKRIITLLLILVVGVVYAQNPPEKVLKGFAKKFPKVKKGVTWSKIKILSDSINELYIAKFEDRKKATTAKYSPNGYWIETEIAYTEDRLSRGILKYIYENHYEDDLELAKKVIRHDKNDYYYVKMKRFKKKQFRPYYFELWFDLRGKIQKVKRPDELKSDYFITAELPKKVAKTYMKKYRNVKDAKWRLKGDAYVGEFTYRTIPMETYISKDSAQWIKTIEKPEIKKARIFSPVKRYVEKNYPKYKIAAYQKIVYPNKTKSYYHVKLLAKKKKTSPQEIELDFNKSGKLME
jgi:hypothetical protein